MPTREPRNLFFFRSKSDPRHAMLVPDVPGWGAVVKLTDTNATCVCGKVEDMVLDEKTSRTSEYEPRCLGGFLVRLEP
jgi:hypothetical protein